MHSKKILLFKIVTVVIAIVVPFYVAEFFFFRYFVFPTNLIAGYYPFAPAQAGSTVRVNQYDFDVAYQFDSQGFRDKEIHFKKNKDEKRILFVGDSITEGFGVPVDKRYSDLAATKLGNEYSSINVAQLATNPDVYFDNVIKFGVALKPDIVVMGLFMGNDFQGGRAYRIPASYSVNHMIDEAVIKSSQSPFIDFLSLKYTRALVSQVNKKEKKLIKRFVVGNFWDLYFGKKMTKDFFLQVTHLNDAEFNNITSSFNQKLLPYYFDGKIIPTLLIEGIRDKLSQDKQEQYLYNEADYSNTLWFIKETQKILTQAGIQFIVVVIPDVNQVHPDEFQKVLREDFKIKRIPLRLSQLEELRMRLVEDLEKEHIQHLDVTDILKAHGGLTYYLYDQHLNTVGHKIIGDALLNMIKNVMK